MEGFFGQPVESKVPDFLTQIGSFLGENKMAILGTLAGAAGGEGGWDGVSKALLGLANGGQLDQTNRDTRTKQVTAAKALQGAGLNPQQLAVAQGLSVDPTNTALKGILENQLKPPEFKQFGDSKTGYFVPDKTAPNGVRRVVDPAAPELPNGIRELQYLQQNPQLAELDAKRKQAGAIRIDNTQKLETEEQKKKNEFGVKYFGDIVNEAPVVRGRIADLNQLADLSGTIQTGGAAPFIATVDNIGSALGITDGKFASTADGINALTNRLAPALRQAGSGSQSDSELRGFLKSLPNLSNTPEGNKVISSSLRRAAAIEEERTQVSELYLSGQIPQQEAWAKMREINSRSIFNSKEEKDTVLKLGGNPNSQQGNATNQGMTQEQAAQERARMGMPVQVKSRAEALALPVGTRFKTPDGRDMVR
jgi:hypothetical protein